MNWNEWTKTNKCEKKTRKNVICVRCGRPKLTFNWTQIRLIEYLNSLVVSQNSWRFILFHFQCETFKYLMKNIKWFCTDFSSIDTSHSAQRLIAVELIKSEIMKLFSIDLTRLIAICRMHPNHYQSLARWIYWIEFHSSANYNLIIRYTIRKWQQLRSDTKSLRTNQASSCSRNLSI